MKKRWTIVSCANEKFATGLIMAMVSCLARSRGKYCYDFVALDGGLSEDSKRLLKESLENVSKKINVPYTVRFITPPEEITQRLPQRAGTWMAYARLLLYELLPDKRVIYIDSDILLMRGIEDFFTLWDDNRPLAAIQDPKKYLITDWHLKETKISRQEPYFNTGLMGMDLSWMRENMTIEIFFKWVDKIGADKLKYADQTVINNACRGLIQEMPRENNWVLATELACQVNEKWEEVNLHYVGRIKPWMTPSCSPRRYLAEVLFQKAAEAYELTPVPTREINKEQLEKNRRKAFWYRFWNPERGRIYRKVVDAISPAETIIANLSEKDFYHTN